MVREQVVVALHIGGSDIMQGLWPSRGMEGMETALALRKLVLKASAGVVSNWDF
jgi:hypothetical protein